MIKSVDTIAHWSDLMRTIAAIFDQSGTDIGRTFASYTKELSPFGDALTSHSQRLPFDLALTNMQSHPMHESLSALLPFIPFNLRGTVPWTLNDPDIDAAAAEHGWVELVGPEGLQSAEHFRFGFYWQREDVNYPRHRHVADEFYHVLSGTAQWQKGTGDDYHPREPGSSFTHASMEDHATRTQAEPLLAIWGWYGDHYSTFYSMDA